MKRIELNDTGVLFFEFDHSYVSAENKPLQGITTMLKSQLFQDMYSDIPEYILRNAAEWGTARHKEMEEYVNRCIASSAMNVCDYDICNKFTEDYPPKGLVRGQINLLAAEYSVTDFKKHASNIDLVIQVGENEVVLVDYKTYSDFTDAKKCYVRWQLSLYKYMFELSNPDVKVVGGYAYIYNKKGAHYFWDCEDFVPSEDCAKLIECEDNGEQYISKYPATPNTITDLSMDKVDEIVTFLELSAKVEAMKKSLNENILAYMESMRAKEIVNDRFKVTYIASTERTSIDTKKLQEKYPEIYKELLKKSSVKSSIKFKLNN